MVHASVERLEKLLESAEFVHLTELKGVPAEARYRLTYRCGNRSFTEVGASVAEILERLIDRPRRRCSRCGEHKDIREFARRKDRVAGRVPHCRVCDRQRQRRQPIGEPGSS